MKFSALRFLGHSAVFFESKEFVVAIDPWLEGNPLCPKDLHNPKKLDVIVLTHGHADHASDAIRLAKLCGSKVIATYELANLLIENGLDDSLALPANKGGTVEISNLSVTLTHAIHSSSFDTAAGGRYAGEPCGVLLRTETQSLYHAGDTALFSDLKLIGELYSPELACLPIGDRFTMGPKEAALAAKFLNVRRAVPIHYKTFDMLVQDSREFVQECKQYGIVAQTLEIGQTITLE